MDQPGFSTGGNTSPTRRELQGPRPAQLKVRKDSYKIKKPPLAHPLPQPPAPPQPPPQPVIIYSVSPKVIHTTVSDFQSLVQRLTGPYSGDLSTSTAERPSDVSPAARLASIERASPRERGREREITHDLMGLIEGFEVGQIPGILSPAPGALPPIPAGLFSPGSDPQSLSILNDLSPFLYGSMFMPSPSTLFSAPIISPSSSSSYDLSSALFDFY